MIAIYHEAKTSQNMIQGIKALKALLSEDIFKRLCQVFVTDRGSEFVEAQKIEELGCRIFYCDPMAAWQKPHVENNHLLLRFVAPKGKSFDELGLLGQDDLNLMFSHINSYPREELHHKSPFDILSFYHPTLIPIFEEFGIKKIDQDEVNLTPLLIKKS